MASPIVLSGCVMVYFEQRMRRVYESLLIANALPLMQICVKEDGGVEITMRRTVYKRFSAAVYKRGLPQPKITARRGLPYLLARFSCRPGLFCGAVIGAAIVVFSTLFCWRVDVVCLDNVGAVRAEDYVDTAAVAARLSEIGVGGGTFLPSLDVRSAEKRFLIGQEEVSWIAINRRGTVLCAEVRSTHAVSDAHGQYPKEHGDGTAIGTNLRANADGVIRYWALEGGHAVVAHEQMVTKGMLLATGFYESGDGDIVYRRAGGKVFAETIRHLRAEIPFVSVEKTATGKTETRYTLSFFGRDLPTIAATNVTFLEIFRNFGKKTGFLPEEYDTIIDEHPLTLGDGTILPLTLTKETRFYYTVRERMRTEEEALSLAQTEIGKLYAGMTDAVVLSAEAETRITDDALIVTEDVHCIDNIAEAVPYYLKNYPETEETK